MGPSRPFVVGVAGGTGSGKTTVAERLAVLMGRGSLSLVKLDAYYRDRSSLPFEDRVGIDYDHPDAFDWPLLLGHLRALVDGLAVESPVYDFAQHVRSPDTTRIESARIVVVEGILVLYEEELRNMFDLRVFVDTDADVRLLRRIQRDVADRGRTIDSVMAQYLATVRPGHLQFVEPSKRYADVIIPHGGMNEPGVDVLLARVRELVRS